MFSGGRPVPTDIKETGRLVEATFAEGDPERQRHDDEVSRARFDDAAASKPRLSLIDRFLRWAGRRR